jgi:ComF family protein
MLYAYWLKERIPADLIVPVPLHPSRKKERGFNQADLLADVLAQLTGLRLNTKHLVRTRATPPQVGLGIEDRKANVQDAFAWTGDGLDDRLVLLVDDVCTTGATLQSCAQVLRQQGVRSVWALTLARPFESMT